MSDDLKDRPTILRRTPRPAPDEKVDPVDYSPTTAAPTQVQTERVARTRGGVETVTPVAPPAPNPDTERLQASSTKPTVQTPGPADLGQAPARQATQLEQASNTTAKRKTMRREVTFPLSTRVSQEVIDALYAAAEEEGISIREAIEQAIKSRWGQI